MGFKLSSIGNFFKRAGRKVGDLARGAWDGVKKVGSTVIHAVNPVNWAKGLMNLGKKADQMAAEGKSAGEIINAGVKGLGEAAGNLANMPVLAATPLGMGARVFSGAVKAGQQYASGDKMGAFKTAIDTGKAAKGDANRLYGK